MDWIDTYLLWRIAENTTPPPPPPPPPIPPVGIKPRQIDYKTSDLWISFFMTIGIVAFTLWYFHPWLFPRH
jgi:hypothetical protein